MRAQKFLQSKLRVLRGCRGPGDLSPAWRLAGRGEQGRRWGPYRIRLGVRCYGSQGRAYCWRFLDWLWLRLIFRTGGLVERYIMDTSD